MRNPLIFAIAIAMSLAGCGGGGSNTRPDPMPIPPAPEAQPQPEAPEPEPEPPVPVPEPPPPDDDLRPYEPTGLIPELRGSCGIELCVLFWDNPFVSYRNHATTHVYRSTSNDFSTATRIGQATGIAYVDYQVVAETTYFYWIVWESTTGMRGPASSPLNDRPARNPSDVIQELSDQILNDEEEEEEETEAPPDALTGPADLQSVGTATESGTASYSVVNVGGRFPGTFAGTRPIYSFNNWGLWAKVGDRTLFRVDIRSGTFALTRHVEGSQSGSNPVSGSAVWTGGVRAYDAHPDTYGTPVTGTARLEVDFSAATVDVDFTGFSGGHPDLSWDGLRIGHGRFGDQRAGYREIIGAFYGAEHQGRGGQVPKPAAGWSLRRDEVTCYNQHPGRVTGRGAQPTRG